MDDGNEKEKRFLLLHIHDQTVYTCVINTTPAKLLINSAALRRCQIAMPVSKHPFMDHDSWVDCTRGWPFLLSNVLRQLAENSKWIYGEVSGDLRDAVCGAIKVAPTISSSNKTMWMNALRPR